MDELKRELGEGFAVRRREFPGNKVEISLFKEDRFELIITGDRMRGNANAHRAILSQIEEGSFTAHDMKLREFILDRYPRSRPTPFPWSFHYEPDFEVEG